MTKHKLYFAIIPAFMAVFAFGFFLGGNTQNASAQEACTVDRALLARIYNAIFHRPLDAGADFHVGRPLSTVLTDLEGSDEHTLYTGLVKATKALEEAKRTHQLSADDLEMHRKMIDSALSHVSAWAETLPQQAIDNAVVGPEQAHAAILRAYERMNATAREKAESGLFRTTERIGHPDNLQLPTLRPESD